MADFIWVANEETLKRLVNHLETQRVVAVDTESDSLYSYFEKVCLLQISTASADYIVDPLAVDITPLAPFFVAKKIEKVFHAADYDVMTLRRDYGFVFNNIFDTMVAAKVLGWPKHGLGDILKNVFNVKQNKKFQQYNWGKRPLDSQALYYAHLDTLYLRQLRDVQLQELQKLNYWVKAKTAFDKVARAKATPKVFDPANFWRIKGANNLQVHQQAMLQALYIFRDKYARQVDKPAFKVMSDSTMYHLVLVQPKSLNSLKKVKGLNPIFLKRQGRKILSLLQNANPEQIRYKKRNSSKYRKK